jgi:phospholipase C
VAFIKLIATLNLRMTKDASHYPAGKVCYLSVRGVITSPDDLGGNLMTRFLGAGLAFLMTLALPRVARADGNLRNLKHIIIVMQESHSFDNYFGVLPFIGGSPYHPGPCTQNDHACVDGLSCSTNRTGVVSCSNSNLNNDGGIVTSFHQAKLCTGPDLQHSWPGSHLEANFTFPNSTLASSLNDGFVRENDATEQIDSSGETASDADTMGFYTPAELPFYYQLAETFALDDRYFSSIVGPTFPNRSYLMAATSFGHLNTAETVPDPIQSPFLFYRPMTGTIFDLLDRSGISWADYSDDVPQGVSFRDFSLDPLHFRSFSGHGAFTNLFNSLLQDAQAGTLPAVAFVDPNFGFRAPENDEHPPTDIRAGEAFVAQVIKAIRGGPNWKDSIIFVTYDEHGGFYDHQAPAPAPQGNLSSPDAIQPGLCADDSDPPASETPGAGLACGHSMADAMTLCPMFDPASSSYPSFCASFNQLGFRVPFLAISPFSKPHYVSHTVGDHTSLLALIEKRFLSPDGGTSSPHLTARDQHADTLEDLFDFDHSPSIDTVVADAPPPSSTDNGCS